MRDPARRHDFSDAGIGSKIVKRSQKGREWAAAPPPGGGVAADEVLLETQAVVPALTQIGNERSKGAPEAVTEPDDTDTEGTRSDESCAHQEDPA